MSQTRRSFLAGSLASQGPDLASPIVASERVTTSITSQRMPQKTLDDRGALNPDLLMANSEHRGTCASTSRASGCRRI